MRNTPCGRMPWANVDRHLIGFGCAGSTTCVSPGQVHVRFFTSYSLPVGRFAPAGYCTFLPKAGFSGTEDVTFRASGCQKVFFLFIKSLFFQSLRSGWPLNRPRCENARRSWMAVKMNADQIPRFPFLKIRARPDGTREGMTGLSHVQHRVTAFIQVVWWHKRLLVCSFAEQVNAGDTTECS